MKQAGRGNLEGIRGWLIFVVIGLCLTPLQVGLTIVNTHVPIFVDGTWQVLTSKESDVYHPLWAPLITFEIWGNLMIMALALTTLVFLFKRSKYTPRLAIIWYATAMVFAVSDYFLALQIPAIADQPTDKQTVKDTVRVVLRAAVWIPYFMVSERVKATFVREWPYQDSAYARLRAANRALSEAEPASTEHGPRE